jgi:hypothetical protein
VAVLVVRYFGGVKLGASGLVRAYGGVAAEALRRGEKVPLVERVLWEFRVLCPGGAGPPPGPAPRGPLRPPGGGLPGGGGPARGGGLAEGLGGGHPGPGRMADVRPPQLGPGWDGHPGGQRA